MSGKSGFTLVEVLVAAVILSAGMVAILQGLSVAVNGLNTTREIMVVSDCFEDKLAEMQLLSWPQQEPAPMDGGSWVTPAGLLNWSFHSETLISATNMRLYRVVLEAAPAGRPGRYAVATEWLTMRGRQ